MRGKLSIALSVLATLFWAVPFSGTAFNFSARAAVQPDNTATPRLIRFRVDRDRGLLVSAWINQRGPFAFAIDTGAGFSLVSQRLVDAAGLTTTSAPRTLVGGLSGTTTTSTREATISNLALGSAINNIQGESRFVVIPQLAPGVDGIIDPAQIFAPRGYSIDIPRRMLEVSDQPQLNLNRGEEGAIVEWVARDDSDRPFVKLGDGRLALIDTGSRFGLAVNSREAVVRGRNRRQPVPALDVGGGSISARRVAPTTISIGELVLRGIPTDILSGITDDAPLILGRDALSPFRITFDPRRRLIAFAASQG